MKITVYDCIEGQALAAAHGPNAEHPIRWLSPHLPEAEFVVARVAAGAAPPAPGETGGVLLTGSEKGVYDDAPWMAPLRANLQAHRAFGTPIFGICFGHQLMADVFGGKAEKAGHGFVVGTRRFEIGGTETQAHVAHQDQVSAVPPGARVTASAPYCPVAALAYDFPAMSVQFHPEYDASFTRDIITTVGPELMAEPEVAAALQTVSGDVARDLYAQEVAAFFRAHLSG